MEKLPIKTTIIEPKYMCAYCGRKFVRHTSHKCNGNFRKHKIKWIEL